MVIGQAPGIRVQKTGIPWNDPSGKELRRWLNVTDEQFYNPELFAIVPMGFCYPGTGKSGDLPPRKECAPQWHPLIWQQLPNIQLTLLIGKYAQSYYLKEQSANTITENIKNWQQFFPQYLPLVHPSPRNRIWQKKNPWFEKEILPILREQVHLILDS